MVRDDVDVNAILTKEYMMAKDLKIDYMTEEQYDSLFAEEQFEDPPNLIKKLK